MRNRKLATDLGCLFWIMACVMICGSIALTYVIITSDLPDWVKYLLLK